MIKNYVGSTEVLPETLDGTAVVEQAVLLGAMRWRCLMPEEPQHGSMTSLVEL